MDTQQYALPAESITVTPIDAPGRYLVTVQLTDTAEEVTTPELEGQVLAAFRKLGVAAAQVAFIYTQGAPVTLTQEVKPPEPMKRSHRG